MTTTTIPLPSGFFGDTDTRSYVANETRAARAGLEPCITCGRGVAAGKGSIIIVTDGGGSILHPDADTPEARKDPGYMGGYVVGSSCVKSIPAAFRTVWEGAY